MPELNQWPTGRLLSTAARLIEHAWNERLSVLKVTHAGMIALDVLAMKGPLTQAALASIVRVQAQTMGKTLSRLESYGHIQRQRNANDRRSHVVSLTDAGRALLEEAHELERGLLDESDVETEALRENLKRVIRGLSKGNVPVVPDLGVPSTEPETGPVLFPVDV
ncbi:MAG: MarR family winged helix-turn-helix transcriptional regulator [Actinomycetales bacterium]|jgi:DNA-binding MarR family transcriptional regulator